MNEDRFGSGIELMFGVGFCLLPIFVFGAGLLIGYLIWGI